MGRLKGKATLGKDARSIEIEFPNKLWLTIRSLLDAPDPKLADLAQRSVMLVELRDLLPHLDSLPGEEIEFGGDFSVGE